MFTGIVTQRALVTDAEPLAGSAVGAGEQAVRLRIALVATIPGLLVGDSVALDGCCLTVVSIEPGVSIEAGSLSFDAIPETLRKTTIGARRPGDRVNVEAALRMGDAMGGHIVQGHVDGVGVVRAIERRAADVRLEIGLPDSLLGAMIPKGSITIDGVSLTVGECGERTFSVYLIPHTLAVTGLGERRVGDAVNLEADVIGRYVEHHVRRVLGASSHRGVAAQEVVS